MPFIHLSTYFSCPFFCSIFYSFLWLLRVVPIFSFWSQQFPRQCNLYSWLKLWRPWRAHEKCSNNCKQWSLLLYRSVFCSDADMSGSVYFFFEQNSPVRITTHYLITDTFHLELCNTFKKIQLSVWHSMSFIIILL